MLSTNPDRKAFKKIGRSTIFFVFAVSIAIGGQSEALSQGTNATTTNATNATDASGGQGGQTTVAMLLGSVDPNTETGYDPDPVTVSPGAVIVWDNQDNALHTATSGDPTTAVPDGMFDSGLVGAMTQSQPVTMPSEPGEYTYFCTLHPFLTGTVVVQ
jgi:plastocyanin